MYLITLTGGYAAVSRVIVSRWAYLRLLNLSWAQVLL